MFERYRLQTSPNVNRPTDDEMVEGEWVDIDDDSDNEVTFPNARTQIDLEEWDLEDTLPLNESTRQQDEYPDDEPDLYGEIYNQAEGLNESVYISADEGDYDDYEGYNRYQHEAQEQHYNTSYTQALDTNSGLYYTPQTHIGSTLEVLDSHAVVSNSGESSQDEVRMRLASVDTGYETEVGPQNIVTQNTTAQAILHHPGSYVYGPVQDEFMGQFDDIDEIAYKVANQVSPQKESRYKCSSATYGFNT